MKDWIAHNCLLYCSMGFKRGKVPSQVHALPCGSGQRPETSLSIFSHRLKKDHTPAKAILNLLYCFLFPHVKKEQALPAPQTVDKPYEKVSEGHHNPLTGFVSTGYAGHGRQLR